MESENYEKPQEEPNEGFPEMLAALSEQNTEKITKQQTESDIKRQETVERKKTEEKLESLYVRAVAEEEKKNGGESDKEKNEREKISATDGTKIGRKVFGFAGDLGMGVLKFGARKIKDAGMYAFNVAFRPWENERGRTTYFPNQSKEKPKK